MDSGAHTRSQDPVAGLLVLLLTCTVLQRFALNMGTFPVSLALIALYALLTFALFSGRLEVTPTRLVAWTACMFVALGSAVVNNNFAPSGADTSLSSLLLLVVLYLPFVFRIATLESGEQATALRWFGNIAVLCALAGIVQFYAQFIFRADWLFDYTPYIPSFLRGPSGYNTVIAVDGYYKSNGFFFREPSGFSFIMALGLILEWLRERRAWRLGCLGLALLLSYSGTGILAVLIALLVPFGSRMLLRLCAMGIAGALAYWLLGDLLNLSFTIERLSEFQSSGSSAYQRYIAPMRFVLEQAQSTPWSLWLGHGPGSITRGSHLAFVFHDPTWAKLLFEYGVLGLASFVLLMLLVTRQHAIAVQIRTVIVAHWLIMGGHLLKPESIALTFALFSICGIVAAGKTPAVPVLPAPSAQPSLLHS